MNTNEITSVIVDAAYKIHTEIGPGLLESVYEILLANSLRKKGLKVTRQVPIPIHFDGDTFDEDFALTFWSKTALSLKSNRSTNWPACIRTRF